MNPISDKAKQNAAVVKEAPPYIYTGEELVNMKVTEIRKLWGSLFPKSGIGILAGSSNVAKSYWLQQFAKFVTTMQEEFLGMPLKAEHGSVIYLATEDSKEALAFRMGIMAKDLQAANLKGLRFLEDSKNLLKRLEDELERLPADLIVIDTLGDIFRGDINRINIVREFLDPFKQLAWKHNCFILFNHHTVKGKDDGPVSKDSLNGSAGIEGATRVVVILKRDASKRTIRHLYTPKANYASEEDQSNVIELDFDFEGDGFTLIGNSMAGSNNAARSKEEREAEELAAVKKLKENDPDISHRRLAEEMQKIGHKVKKTKAGQLSKKWLAIKSSKEEESADIDEDEE